MGEILKEKIPRHVAIIMDGNGRWAKSKFLSRIKGHQKGLETAKEIVKAAREMGIEILTLYAFSQENWKRPQAEVNALMNLLKEQLHLQLDDLMEHNIKFNAIGNLNNIPRDVLTVINYVMEQTANNKGMVLNVALSYGGRSEIINAVKNIILDCKDGKLSADDIDEKLFSKYLYTNGMSDPDLLIRTSREYRISNFLLWQIAYTEIYFTDVLWPDFTREDFIEAINEYQKRERRFGLTSEQIKDGEIFKIRI